MPRTASSSTMWKFLRHISRYCIALNLIFPAFTLYPILSNFRSSLQQMEPTPSQVKNHYSQKHQEAHLERALAFKKAANLHFPSKVCIPIICHCASYCGWLISLVSLMNHDDETDQEIGDDDSEDTGQSTLSSDIDEDDLHHHQKVLHLGQACWDKSLRTTRVPLPKKRSCADTVIAHPPLANSRNLPAAMVPPQLKREKSSLLNKSSGSVCAPSARALVLPNKCSGDQNLPQPKATSDQNVPRHQKPTYEEAKMFIEAIVFTKTPWPIFSGDMYSIVEEAWKLVFKGQDRQWALAGAPVDTPSVCQLPGGPSLKIDPQTREAVSLECCLMLLYQTYG